jgi:hypothetical protein
MSALKKSVFARSIALLGTLVVALMFIPSSVLAADTEGKHCIAKVAPIQPGQQGSTMVEGQCFAYLADAIAAATANKVRLPKDATSAEVVKALRDRDAQQSFNMATRSITGDVTVIAIEYLEEWAQGATLTISTDGLVGCSATRTFGWTNMPAGWVNSISSARVFGGCNHAYHYDSPDYKNGVLDCWGGCNIMGALNNQTESIRWTR